MIALVATCGLDAASVFILFGLLQIATGLLYGIPMPVQPLKAMAATMLAQRLSPETLAGGGLLIGVVMLVVSMTGLLDWLTRVVPKQVVRGFSWVWGSRWQPWPWGCSAMKDGASGYALSLVAVAILLALRHQRRVPAPLIVIGLGFAYSLFLKLGGVSHGALVGLRLPVFHTMTLDDLRRGALLALPQIPLSLGNSVIATSQTTHDLSILGHVDVETVTGEEKSQHLRGSWIAVYKEQPVSWRRDRHCLRRGPEARSSPALIPIGKGHAGSVAGAPLSRANAPAR